MMSKAKGNKPFGRGPDRRKGERRKTYIDPADLPFPDRRKGDRRQKDRRVFSEEEREELLKRIKEGEGES